LKTNLYLGILFKSEIKLLTVKNPVSTRLSLFSSCLDKVLHISFSNILLKKEEEEIG
jgi:hypothetical protein